MTSANHCHKEETVAACKGNVSAAGKLRPLLSSGCCRAGQGVLCQPPPPPPVRQHPVHHHHPADGLGNVPLEADSALWTFGISGGYFQQAFNSLASSALLFPIKADIPLVFLAWRNSIFCMFDTCFPSSTTMQVITYKDAPPTHRPPLCCPAFPHAITAWLSHREANMG